MDFLLIDQASQLEPLCKKMAQTTTLMVDTEFVRTKTLYPKLGLIQLFDGETLALVDPIAIDDLTPLWSLLRDESITKVLHACSEDLEVFQHHAGFMPSPLVDTQVMAAFTGLGLSVGFAALVKDYLDISLDKGEARTDWCARPLTSSQLNYAAADVFYLLPLYNALKEKVAAKGWQDAVVNECEQLLAKRGKKVDIENAYLNIKNAWQLNQKQLAALKLLATWRVQQAQKKDLALNFVVKDVHLWKMVKLNIRSLDKMAAEGFNRFEIERHGHTMLRMMRDADKIPAEDYPEKIERLVDKAGYKQAMDAIKSEIATVAEKLQLAPEFVGSNKQINKLLTWLWMEGAPASKTPELLTGWRGEYLKEKLTPILDTLK